MEELKPEIKRKRSHSPIAMIIILPIFISILYFPQLLIVHTFTIIHETTMTSFHYFIPLIILGSFAILMLSKYISLTLFSYIYILFGIMLSMELYTTFTSLIILLIFKFTTIPLTLSYFILLIIPIIICIYGIVNVYITKIDFITLKSKHIQNKKRIVHLSDLHLGTSYQKSFVERIVKQIQQLKPDVVAITGDVPDGPIKVKNEWLSPFDKLDIPIVYVTGNHEAIHGTESFLQILNSTKIIHIESGVKEIEGINFIGIDFGYDLKETLSHYSSQYKDSGKVNVLLHHIPSITADELEKFGVFLFLSGHTHGGQIFPLHIFAYLANKCYAGLYRSKNGKSNCYVSTGVGASVTPMRIGTRSVIGVIDIEGVEKEESEKEK